MSSRMPMQTGRISRPEGCSLRTTSPASRWIEGRGASGGRECWRYAHTGHRHPWFCFPTYMVPRYCPKASENQELAIKFIKDKLLQEQFQIGFHEFLRQDVTHEGPYEKLDNPYWPTVLDFYRKSNDASSETRTTQSWIPTCR